MSELEIQESYEKNKLKYERAAQSVKREIDNFIEDIDPELLHYSTYRIKSLESVIRKYKELKLKLEDMDDVAGVRVICRNISDRDTVLWFIKERYKNHRIARKDELNGYRAIHIILQIQVLVAGIPKPVTVEIQLRTTAEDYYDVLSRRDLYRKPAAEAGWFEEMRKASNELKRLDEKLERLKQKCVADDISTQQQKRLTVDAIKQLVKMRLKKEISIKEAVVCCIKLKEEGMTIEKLINALNNHALLGEAETYLQRLLGGNFEK